MLRALPVLLFASACTGADAEPSREPPAALDDLVSWEASFDLEERPEAVVVLPAVSLDPRGGFLVADQREAQVRRYAPDGRLLWFAGRRGDGPGEFYAPACAARLPSGEVVVTDRNGRLTTFDSAGAVVATVNTRINGGGDCALLGDSALLISGNANGDREGPRLHVWHLRAQRVQRSFFAPYANSPDKAVARMAGWARFAIRGDTIAATFSTSDTLYFFAVDGTARGKIPIPSRFFRRDRVAPPRAGQAGPAVQMRWLSKFDFIENVFWLADGSLLIPYQTPHESSADTLTHHLLAMRRNGDLVFESRDVPRLLNVDPRSRTLYFVRRGAETRNQWAVARLRASTAASPSGKRTHGS